VLSVSRDSRALRSSVELVVGRAASVIARSVQLGVKLLCLFRKSLISPKQPFARWAIVPPFSILFAGCDEWWRKSTQIYSLHI